ncbi:small proline-rich protein 2H [Drosophila serrata]|uniref:small proline-rich protein 2H n=1 Tax=Drosophila serrata TaxID=7274 RepID=UPI000A1D16E0|nr:small proline-rich protein 2H [Drosophila serrata]
MSSPGGKCNTCPCGTTGGAPQPCHRSPPSCVQQQQQQQQMNPCPPQQQMNPCPPQQQMNPCPPQQQMNPCPPQQQMNPCPPQQLAGCQIQQHQPQRPQIECNCTQNRVRNVRPPPIQADVVSCCRPPPKRRSS